MGNWNILFMVGIFLVLKIGEPFPMIFSGSTSNNEKNPSYQKISASPSPTYAKLSPTSTVFTENAYFASQTTTSPVVTMTTTERPSSSVTDDFTPSRPVAESFTNATTLSATKTTTVFSDDDRFSFETNATTLSATKTTTVFTDDGRFSFETTREPSAAIVTNRKSNRPLVNGDNFAWNRPEPETTVSPVTMISTMSTTPAHGEKSFGREITRSTDATETVAMDATDAMDTTTKRLRNEDISTPNQPDAEISPQTDDDATLPSSVSMVTETRETRRLATTTVTSSADTIGPKKASSGYVPNTVPPFPYGVILENQTPGTEIIVSPKFDFDCKNKKDGKYGDPKQPCSAYYFECVEKRFRQMPCPQMLYFDETTGICNYKSDVLACNAKTTAADSQTDVDFTTKAVSSVYSKPTSVAHSNGKDHSSSSSSSSKTDRSSEEKKNSGSAEVP